MRALVLAAGRGERLAPLTHTIPKPLLPVLNEALLFIHIRTLFNYGVDEILINVHHHADKICQALARNDCHKARVTIRRELELRGPAGSMLTFADAYENDDMVLVLSGDGVHDVDLEAMVEHHHASGAPLTVALKKVSDPGRFGVAKLTPDGMVARFAEKPAIDPTERALVSCGIYCVSPGLIRSFPEDRPYDFGADVIPERVAAGEAVAGFVVDGYWTDIGSPEALRRANLDAVEGRIRRVRPPSGDLPYVHPTAHVDPSAVITGDVIVGEGAWIGPGAVVEGPAVVGPRSSIGRNVYVASSVLLRDARLADQMYVCGALIGPWLGNNAC